MKRKLIPLTVLAGMIILVSLQNHQSVVLKFLFWKSEMPLIILIYATFLIGLIFGSLITRINSVFKRKKDKK